MSLLSLPNTSIILIYSQHCSNISRSICWQSWCIYELQEPHVAKRGLPNTSRVSTYSQAKLCPLPNSAERHVENPGLPERESPRAPSPAPPERMFWKRGRSNQ